MIEKQVPLTIQNHVRSYLIYVEYEKKVNRHTTLMSRLASKLSKVIIYNGYNHLYKEKFIKVGIKTKVFEIGQILEERLYQADSVIYDVIINIFQPNLTEKQGDMETYESIEEVKKPYLYFIVNGGTCRQFARY